MLAHPPSKLYALRKGLKRHRSAALVGMIFFLLLIYSSVTVVQSKSQQHEALIKKKEAIAEAKAESQKYDALFRFVKSNFPILFS